MNWINIKDGLPTSDENVLVYWYDAPFGIHQIAMVRYFTKGAVMDNLVDMDEPSTAKRMMDWLFNPDNEIKATQDGFYICDGDGREIWRRHADCITHWMYLPAPPKEDA